MLYDYSITVKCELLKARLLEKLANLMYIIGLLVRFIIKRKYVHKYIYIKWDYKENVCWREMGIRASSYVV